MRISRRFRPVAIALGATLVGLVLGPFALGAFDGRVYDIGIVQRPPRPPADIEILGIDDAFMAGRHAYLAPRDRLAKLINALATARPKVVVLDVWLDSWFDDGPDRALRDALLHAKREKVPVLLSDVALKVAGKETKRTGVTARGSVLPFFREAAFATGDAGMPAEADDVVRAMPPASGQGATEVIFLPLLVAETASRVASADEPRAKESRAQNAAVRERLRNEPIPIDYRGGPGSVRTTTAIQVVQQPPMASLLQDKIVFIGATSPRLYDIFETPYTYLQGSGDRPFYGVELLAHATATLMDGAPRRSHRTPAALWQLGLVTLVMTALTAWLALRGAISGLIFTVLAVGGALYLGVFSAREAPPWLGSHFWPPSVLLIAAPLACGIGVALRQWEQARELKLVSDAFGAYVGPEVLEKMGGKMPELGGELRDIAVLFCDIRGYSALAERMQDDPAKLMNELNAHFEPLVQALKDHGAYADNYVGDLVMALFGAPISSGNFESDVRNSVAAARAFVRLVDERNEGRREAGLEPIEVGIGLHCGEAVVGNLGTLGKQSKIHYTAIGDVVNIASRIESTTRKYEVPLLVSEEVVQSCARADGKAADEWVFVDETMVKGRTTPVRLYKPTVVEEKSNRKDAEAQRR
jgi:adenylate cyclase